MIGDNIKILLRKNNYTQKELAIRSGCTKRIFAWQLCKRSQLEKVYDSTLS